MPRKLLAAVLAVFCAIAALGVASPARAEGDGHGTQGFIVLDQLETVERQRARKLFSEIVCKCPNENWSKSLLNCPDGCADQQKQEILHQIQDGWDDAKIVEFQVQMYGPRALGKPDDLLTYLLPVLTLVGAVVVVGFVIARWRKSAAIARDHRRASEPADHEELAAVERELRELR